MELVDCHVGYCCLRLHHVCQIEYVLLNDINFYGVSRIFFAIVLMSLGGSKSDKLKKEEDSTVSGAV